MPCVLVPRLVTLLVVNFTYATRPGASARCAARHVAHRRLLRLTQACRRLLRLHRTFGCLGTSRGSSRGSSCRSSSTTSTTPRVRVPRHVARLVTWLVAPLIVDNSASRRLVVDYLAYTARPGASARRAAHRRLLFLTQACRRLLRLRRASRCLGTSRGSSCRSSSTTSTTPRVRVPRHVTRLFARLVTGLVAPLVVDYSASRRLVVDYLAYTVRPGASTRRTARHRLLHLA
jgi:hypothetical protein